MSATSTARRREPASGRRSRTTRSGTQRWARRVGIWASAGLFASGAVLTAPVISTGGSVASASPTAGGSETPAAWPLSCAPGTIYNLDSTGHIYSLASATGANTYIGSFGATAQMNALGVTANGGTAIGVLQYPTGPSTTLYEDSSGHVTQFSVPAPSAGIVAGGVDPTNDYYYYGGYNVSGTSFDLYAFDLNTNTAVGEVGTIAIPNSSASVGFQNGDLAFDQLGNMYLLAGADSTAVKSEILRVVPPPMMAGTGALAASVLTTLLPSIGQDNGIAFDSSGSLYAESSQRALFEIDADNGSLMSQIQQTGLGRPIPVDLASCTYNGTLQVEKNIVSRYQSSDQFTMTITGGGVISGNTGTTSGTSAGLQTGPGEVAGPIVGIPGTTYTGTETAASGDLADYSTTWSCLNGESTLSEGTGTSFTLAFPTSLPASGANVICTFTNTALVPGVPSISIVKSASPTTYSAPGTTITYSYDVTNTGNVTLTNVNVLDNKLGAIASCADASLAPGASETCQASYTTVQGDLDAGSVTNVATATGTPPTGSQVTATASATVTAVQTPAISIVKSASVTSYSSAGTPVTYSYAVTNTGNVTLNPVTVTDPMTGLSVVACPAVSLSPGASETCTATYTTTSVDVTAGSISNIGTATGAPRTGPVVTATSALKIPAATSVTTTTAAPPTTTAAPPTTTAAPPTTTAPSVVTKAAESTAPVKKAAPHKKVATKAVTAVAKPKTIAAATTVHTGEPWSGSRPYLFTLFMLGLSLLSFGLIRSRRREVGRQG